MSALAGVLQGFHAVIAFQRSEPHWLLNDDESKKYGIALGNAMRHLPIQVAQKSLDFSALVMIAFSIETPRVVKSVQAARARQGRPAQAPRGPAQVFEFRQPSPSPASPPPAATPPAAPSQESPLREPREPPAPMVEPDFSDTLGGNP
jgi:hypothetical protein